MPRIASPSRNKLGDVVAVDVKHKVSAATLRLETCVHSMEKTPDDWDSE